MFKLKLPVLVPVFVNKDPVPGNLACGSLIKCVNMKTRDQFWNWAFSVLFS